MGIEVILGISVSVGVALAFLLALALRESERRRARRNLASAFIGEIAAALREIEISNVVSAVESLCVQFDDRTVADLPSFELPHFAIYEAYRAIAWWSMMRLSRSKMGCPASGIRLSGSITS